MLGCGTATDGKTFLRCAVYCEVAIILQKHFGVLSLAGKAKHRSDRMDLAKKSFTAH